MKRHRRRAALATVIVTALIGWAGAGMAAAETKWDGGTPDETKWDIVTPTETKWE